MLFRSVRDSGVIRVPRYFASDLPVGDYTANLSVRLGGQWLVRQTPFHVSVSGANIDREMETALWATDRVRKMAFGYAFHHSPLWTEVANEGRRSVPVCTQYATALLALEREMNIGRAMDADKQPRILIIAYIVNSFDGHTLTEYYHRGLNRWVILDPTFGLAPLRASDGTYATKEDINASALHKDWNAIQYKFLGSYGDAYAKGYYQIGRAHV